MRKLLAFLLCLVLTGCASVSPFAGINPPREPRKIANYAQTEKQVPLKIGVTPDGKDVIAYATERSYSANSAETPEKIGFMQRLGRWIGGLGILTVVLIVVSLAFLGGAPIIWAVKKYYTMKNSFRKVIDGVEELKKTDLPAQTVLTKTILNGSMDMPEKKLVESLKIENSFKPLVKTVVTPKEDI